MKSIKHSISWIEASYSELTLTDKEIIDAACKATECSYSPYSKFSVGAAVLLADGHIIMGSNQENAAYPSGLCAERTAIFSAASNYSSPIIAIAIAAKDKEGFTSTPPYPCGACRQVLAEYENIYKRPIRVLLYSSSKVLIIEQGCSVLLPLGFSYDNMTQ